MAKASENPRFHILVPVWGKTYVQAFLNYLAPSLLAEGNLPAWGYGGQTMMQIATTAADARAMESSPIFQRLRYFLPVHFQIFANTILGAHSEISRFEAKYKRLNQIMAGLLHQAMAEGAHVIPLMSDTVLSSHFFSYLQQALQEGVHLLMVAGPRLAPETKSKLEPYRAEGALTLSPQTMNQLLFQALHPHEEACFIDAPTFSQWPSHVYYWESPHQIRSHWFHLHPFFLFRPQIQPGTPAVSIEAELLNQYEDRRERIRVIQASEIAACSVSDRPDDMPAWGIPASLEQRQQMLIEFGEKNGSALQRWFFKQPISFLL